MPQRGLVDDHSGMFTVTHYPSGDTAEADDMDSAVIAAKTLTTDNAGGFCDVLSGGRKMDTIAPTSAGGWLHSRGGKSNY